MASQSFLDLVQAQVADLHERDAEAYEARLDIAYAAATGPVHPRDLRPHPLRGPGATWLAGNGLGFSSMARRANVHHCSWL
jgi:hypothetical protein